MTSHPVLRAATILDANHVEACFDKTLANNSAIAGDFALGGYRAANGTTGAQNIAAAVDQTDTNCVVVTFDPSTVDPSQYTVFEAFAGAVKGNTSQLGNYPDAVGLGFTSSHSGTIGVTTAPNLVGIVPPTGTNITTDSLTFVYDKDAVYTSPLPAGAFFYVDGAGNTCSNAAGAAVSGDASSTITVSFTGSGCANTVTSAVRAGSAADAVSSASDLNSDSVPQSAILPNAPNGGQTTHADLVSTVLGSDGDSIVYTFDKNVVAGAGFATGFVAGLADGTDLISTSAVATGGTTVTARFNGNLSRLEEFGVIAYVDGGTVVNADNAAAGNVPGSGGIGGNAGASAEGFTTAPDVFNVSIAKAAGTITVNLDDRIVAVNVADVVLYDANGDVISAAAPIASFNSSAPPGPETVTLAYPSSALTNVASVGFMRNAFVSNTGLTAGSNDSIAQIVGPVSNSAILKAYRAYKAHHAHHAKSHKKHNHKR